MIQRRDNGGRLPSYEEHFEAEQEAREELAELEPAPFCTDPGCPICPNRGPLSVERARELRLAEEIEAELNGKRVARHLYKQNWRE